MASGIEDADLAHWRGCSFRYRRTDSSSSKELTLRAMQTAIMKGDVTPDTEVRSGTPG